MLHHLKVLLSSLTMLAFFAVAGWAFNRHQELNGTWKLMPAQGQLGGDTLVGGLVTIYDREHNIYISERFSYEDNERTVTYKYSTDGPLNESVDSGDVKSKAKWDGDVLVVRFTQNGLPTTERYRVASDGSLVMTRDKPGHPPETLVFARQ